MFRSILEWIRQFTPWRRIECDTEALYRYLWSEEGKPLTSGTLMTEKDGIRTIHRIVDGKVQDS